LTTGQASPFKAGRVKLREGKKKRDYRMKTANMIVRNALRTRGVIVVERISGDDIRVMIARYRNRQLRHRIYQSALKGELNAIIDKAREYGVPGSWWILGIHLRSAQL